jgi:hypothetical protein
MIIQTNQNPLQSMKTQEKLHNDHHHKWYVYLQQFHLKIKYKKVSTNHIVSCLNWSSIVALTIIPNAYAHETSRWPQLYYNDHKFVVTCQTLGRCKNVPYFHLQDKVLCYVGHICVPSRKYENIIWE